MYNLIKNKIIHVKIILLITVLTTFSVSAKQPKPYVINGAGSTAVGALMQTWISNYISSTDIKINYQPVGSGFGMHYLQNKQFDFAVSDIPISDSILIKNKWVQFPIAISQIDIIYNLPHASHALVLDGNILAKIYMHKIKKWDNPQIQALNPKIKFPHTNILLVYRSNQSGTTYTLTSYLNQVSTQWKKLNGISMLLNTVNKNSVGTSTDKVLSRMVKNLPFSLGYTSDVYAVQQKNSRAELINQEGTSVLATKLYAYAALANITQLQLNNLTNLKGYNSWPLIQASFLILPKNSKKGAVIAKFLEWAFTTQGSITDKLGYIPIPSRFRQTIFSTWGDLLSKKEKL